VMGLDGWGMARARLIRLDCMQAGIRYCG
jgi:hypothetical protein